MDDFSLLYGYSNQSHETSSFKGSTHKVPMVEIVETQVKKMTIRIKDLIEVLRKGNYYYDKSITMVERQAVVVEKQAEIIQRSLTIHE